MRQLGVVVALVASACIRTSTTECGDEICPAGTTCVAITATDTRCVQPEQLGACEDIDDGAECSLGGVAASTCHGGACFPDACGNGLRDVTEACDDANSISGDGCASDCRSDETCGNGVVDPIMLVGTEPVIDEQCDDGNAAAHDGCSACEVEVPRWSQLPPAQPRARWYPAMTFDTRRHELLMFGGTDTFAVTTSETWVWTPAGWTERRPSIAPPGRIAAGFAYDSARDRLVVFGGTDSSFSVTTRDLWEWDGQQWEERVANGPAPRSQHAMVYDSVRHKVVAAGGVGSLYFGDTWLWDGTAWAEVATAAQDALPGRARLGGAFDPIRGETVVFGGQNGTTLYSGETFLFDGTRWRKATPTTSPPARLDATMAWDATSQRVILYGGYNASGALADTWAWDGTDWTRMPDGPPKRYGAALGSDLERGGVVLYGGIDNPTSRLDTWRWDGAAWHDVTTTFEPSFVSCGVAYDPARDAIVTFGGLLGSTPSDITQQFVAGVWSGSRMPGSPPPRVAPPLVYMPSLGEIVMWGGNNQFGTNLADGTWGFNGTAWRRITTSNPPARAGIAYAYDAARDEIVVFGGRASTALNGETWVFDGTTWTQRTPTTSPSARSDASAAYDPIRQRVVLTAGVFVGDFPQDLWTWDGTTWTSHPQPTRPPARYNAALVWNAQRQRLVLAGGFDIAGTPATDAWELDDTTWFRVEATSPPRNSVTVIGTDDGVVRLSGVMPGNNDIVPDVWRLRWEASAADEVCSSVTDIDGDALVGCADPDCGTVCAACGDGTCSTVEDCHFCPGDCGACVERCGDAVCSQGESAASCPGDC